MTDNTNKEPSYGTVWDHYVKEIFPKIKEDGIKKQNHLQPWRVLNTTDHSFSWPGDEWGNEKDTQFIFSQAIDTQLDHEPEFLIEIGSGAGRYTLETLTRYPKSKVLSFDVSRQFELKLQQRCSKYREAGRLTTFLLNKNPATIKNLIAQQGLSEKIDVLYSFDAMVHVDLHTLLIYWITASQVLKQNGLLAMNVADACSDKGFLKLMYDAQKVFRLQNGAAGSHFMWVSPDIVRSTLTRLGFTVTLCRGNGRDLSFAAILRDRTQAMHWLEETGTTPVDW